MLESTVPAVAVASKNIGAQHQEAVLKATKQVVLGSKLVAAATKGYFAGLFGKQQG